MCECEAREREANHELALQVALVVLFVALVALIWTSIGTGIAFGG